MLDFIRKKWLEWLVSVVIVLISAIVINAFAIKRDTAKNIQDELKTKASIEYVDKQNKDLKDYVNTQDQNIKDQIQQAIDAQTKEWQSVDKKLDILIGTKK